MTPQERAALTQEQLDRLMTKIDPPAICRSGGAFHVTLAALRDFEPRFATPLGPKDPSSFEALLMHAVLAEAVATGECPKVARAPENSLENAAEYLDWAIRQGMLAQVAQPDRIEP